MTIWTCVKQDDSHADYPHRLVMPETFVITRNDDNVPVARKMSTDAVTVFVICAHCSHWSQRAVPRCKCRYRCHDRAREWNPAGTLVFTAETGYAGLNSPIKMEAST